MKTNIELRQVRDFGQIISDTLVFLKQNFKPLFKAIAVICGFFIFASIVTNILIDDSTLSMISATKNPDRYTSSLTSYDLYTTSYYFRVMFLVLSMVLSYVSVYLTTYCYIALYSEKGNVPPSVEEVWAYFKFYFWRILGSSFLLVIIAGFGLMLCLSGIYLIPAFAIFLPMMVIENATFSYAFKRTFKLVENYWWQTFGVVFVVGLIVAFLSFIFTAPGQVLQVVQMLVSTKKISLPFIILSGTLKGLGLLTYTVSAIAYCLCYFSLVEVKEGTGLMGRIDTFGKTTANDLPGEEY